MSADLMDALGVRVRRVDDLGEGVVWVLDLKLLLIDFDLSNERITEAIAELLPGLIPDTIDFD